MHSFNNNKFVSSVAMSEQPLMTQSMRKADLEAKYARYSKVIIRIQFPDRLVLQGVFRARETGNYKFF